MGWRTTVRALAALVLVAALVVGVISTQRTWARGELNDLICGGRCGPEAVATPTDLRPPGSPGRTATTASAAAELDPGAVADAVRNPLEASPLGRGAGFVALDPGSGELVVNRNGSATFVPASTTKLLTATAALSALGAEQRFRTQVVRRGERIVLVGGGDPYLALGAPGRSSPEESGPEVGEDLTILAERTAAALAEADVAAVRLGYDDSLFVGPPASRGWEDFYVPADIVTPISALWVDQGTRDGARVDDPAADAAARFAELLREQGVTVRGEAEPIAGGEAEPIAEIASATVAQQVEHMVTTSDNESAEVLLRHVGAAIAGEASFAGGVEAVPAVLRDLGVDVTGLVLFDGSGLSRRNRITPQLLVELVHSAAQDRRTAGVLADLPVSAFSGSLEDRFGTVDAATGAVRAKTGTLTGVHSLAGYTADVDGHPIVFAVMVDGTQKIDPLTTRAALDEVAAALAGCSCTR